MSEDQKEQQNPVNRYPHPELPEQALDCLAWNQRWIRGPTTEKRPIRAAVG